jgi:glycosyltransferase involved in cell wall biosynthesis
LDARIAVVHEWLVDYAGSERVLREILEVLPQAELFALVDRPEAELRAAIPRRARRTSFLQGLPNPKRWLRYCVPLMPAAIERLDVSGYDLVVSSSHTVAKGVLTGPGQLHVSYVHTPMRFAWDLQEEYLRAAGIERGVLGWAARRALRRLRRWDEASARRVDVFLANSRHVAERIRKAYGRDAEVIYPPVDVAAFAPGPAREDFYLTVSRLEAYKRVDLLVEAFRGLPGRRLVVIGAGPELARLRAAAPPNVALPGRLPAEEVRSHMQRARAFLFAGIEDFGIVIAEAQAAGAPVIAYRAGGAAEIVAPASGLFFEEQTVEALTAAIGRFEREPGRFAPLACRENAQRFDRSRFRQRFQAALDAASRRFHGDPRRA